MDKTTHWDAAAEVGFNAWFHGDVSPWTLRSEYFFGDCATGDEKTRQDYLIQWLHAAFVAGYSLGVGESGAKPGAPNGCGDDSVTEPEQ